MPETLPHTDKARGLLFTAFEPSGDDHASVVIAELRLRHPDLPIYALGGEKMRAAGAQILEPTGENAVMGMPGVAKIAEHRRLNRRIADWLEKDLVDVHIPVDSPAANFPLCALSKRRGIRVVHLVAPQIWAWGRWRIRKLRRLTDMVLCLLPFEEGWFLSRGVKARFIGHPLFDQPVDLEALDRRAAELPDGSPRLALMPGSRPSEIKSSLPVLLDAFRRLRRDYPNTVGIIAATRREVADALRKLADHSGGWPEGLDMLSGETDAVIRWCEYALVVSGTVTLQIARQQKPMVTFYRPSRLIYHLIGRWIVSTDVFTLPNLILGDERKKWIPELIPHFGDGEELALAVIRLMRQPGYAEDQIEALRRVTAKFKGRKAAQTAADEIERIAGLRPDS